jgi:hypothetical protein
MQLSEKARDAVVRLKALRRLSSNISTQRAEAKILVGLTLSEVTDVALILSQDEEAKTGRAQ